MARSLFGGTGWVLTFSGTVLFGLLATYLAGARYPVLSDIGFTGMGYYLAATAGSVLVGWGTMLIAQSLSDEGHQSVGVGTAVGFLSLAVTRLLTAVSDAPEFAAISAFLPFEVVLFTALALVFLQVSVDLWGRMVDGFWSLCAAPVWVQIWVWGFLLTANFTSVVLFAVTQHPLPGWIALGFLFVVITNMALVAYERGISKLTSLPHLIPWVPLQIYTGFWLFVWGGLSPTLTLFAWFYFVVIGISNVFDAYDTWRWFRGERETLGSAANPTAPVPRG